MIPGSCQRFCEGREVGLVEISFMQRDSKLRKHRADESNVSCSVLKSKLLRCVFLHVQSVMRQQLQSNEMIYKHEASVRAEGCSSRARALPSMMTVGRM